MKIKIFVIALFLLISGMVLTTSNETYAQEQEGYLLITVTYMGNPVEGAVLEIVENGWPGGPTNSRGQFAWAPPPDTGYYTVWAYYPDYPPNDGQSGYTVVHVTSSVTHGYIRLSDPY